MRQILLTRTDREANWQPKRRRLLPFHDIIGEAKRRNIGPLLDAFGVDSELALPVRVYRRIAMADEVTYRKLETMTFNSGDYSQPTRIPRADLLQYLILYLSGTLTKTETAAGTLNPEGPEAMLDSIEVSGDGDTFYSLNGEEFIALNAYFFGRYPSGTNVTLGTDTAEPFSRYLVVPFESYRSIRPWDTVLRTDLFRNELQIRVKWAGGTFSDLIAGGTYSGVSFPTSPTVEVWAIYAKNPGFVPGFFTRTRRRPIGYSAAGEVNHDFLEDTTIRLIMLRPTGGSGSFTSGVAFDDITDITLETNTGVFNLREIPDAHLREDIYLHNSNVETFRAGYNFYDFAQNGLLRRSLVTRLVSNPKLTVDMAFGGSGTRQLNVVTVELYRPAALVELQRSFQGGVAAAPAGR